MKRLAKGLVVTVRESDWFDWFHLFFFVLAGALFGLVVEELQKEFGG